METVPTCQQNLANLAEKHPPIYKKNMLVIDHQVSQTKSPDSKELEPAAHHLYRIKEVQPKNLRLISIIDGIELPLLIYESDKVTLKSLSEA